MTVEKKKKLTVKNLENLKGGVITVEGSETTEDSKTGSKTSKTGMKGTIGRTEMASAGALATAGGLISKA